MSDEYRMESKPGDVVRFKNGDLGIVIDWEILCGGHVKEIRIYPLVGFWKRLIGTFRYSCWRFAEDEINNLTKVGNIFNSPA